MGFFQDLKEDLSMAVGDLIPEQEQVDEMNAEAEDDFMVEEAMRELEKALEEEFEQIDEDDFATEDVEAETEKETEKEAEAEKEPKKITEPVKAEEENAAPAKKEEKEKKQQPVKEEQEAVAVEPVIGAAAAQIASIANIVAKEESSGDELEEREIQTPEELLKPIKDEKEETELEKEVEKAMEEQKFTLAGEEVADETSVITAGMTISGDIISRGSVEVLGKVNGKVEILGKLNVSGTIEGDSKAAEIFADSARITGKVTADGTIKIGQNSVIIGDIIASSAVVAGAVKGDIDVHGPVILDASAIVMGNIKSKSVQINNGAVIEGMCSQCYAEVNPTSFFDDLIRK